MPNLAVEMVVRSATIRAMSISPSALPWWGWLLCSVGAFIGSILCANRKDGGCLALLLAFVSGLIGFITGGMAVILFIKWFWSG
jgi:hypothetical protein